jgi:hypothetical protein
MKNGCLVVAEEKRFILIARLGTFVQLAGFSAFFREQGRVLEQSDYSTFDCLYLSLSC